MIVNGRGRCSDFPHPEEVEQDAAQSMILSGSDAFWAHSARILRRMGVRGMRMREGWLYSFVAPAATKCSFAMGSV